jgi:hypothetical protein
MLDVRVLPRVGPVAQRLKQGRGAGNFDGTTCIRSQLIRWLFRN